MAKDKKQVEEQIEDYEYQFKKDYQSDWDIHRNYINSFDAYEAMLIGQVYDSVSNSIDGSKITDSYATTLAIERAARVMGKLPDGVMEGVAKSDMGKGAFMDILRQKWIYPNANSQHPFLIKLRLWQLYSSVYGYMPMFYDWNVSPSGYVGPDCWLWNPRNLIPQQGRVSIEDMDYVTAVTWVSKQYLEDMLETVSDEDSEKGGWNADALKQLIQIANNETTDNDGEKESLIARNRNSQATKKGVQLATRYEAGDEGEWITFAPDHSHVEVRRIKNPHKNGKIPFVIKYSQPLFDSFYGLGDFQRAKPLQFARDGLTNFYFRGIKLNLIPPIIANANGVLKHTLDYDAGTVMMETIPNSIRRMETSTAGLATYQAAQTNLTGSLLSLFGTQNASIPGAEALNPSQGKTPAAINMFASREATRDGQERMHLEAAIEKLTDGFFSLVINIGTEDVPIQLFAEDIQEIHKAGLEDVLGMFNGNFKPNEMMSGGELTINPKALKGAEYRFSISVGSTAKENKAEQIAMVKEMLDTLAKYQNIIQEDPRVEVNWGGIFDKFETLLDVKGVSDFVTIKEGPSPQEQALMEEVQGLQQQMEEMAKRLFQTETSLARTELQAQKNLIPPPIDPVQEGRSRLSAL